jgi:Flp pilus assembly protein CpaB
MILLGLAITCGLGASYMTSRLLAERQPADEPERVDILVAKDNISVHTSLRKPEDLFVYKTVAKGDFPDAITDYESLKGKVLKHGRAKGESITAANLYDKSVNVELPKDHQGIAIKVTMETSAEGLASLPGSRVDLHLTLRDTNNVNNTRSLVLLQNVLVVAAGIKTEREGIAAPAPIVTLALKRADALRVNAAMEMGTIRMIMRNQDDDSTATKGEIQVTGREILEGKTDEKKFEIAKVEPKERVEPKSTPQVGDRPKWTKHHWDIVHGSEQGPRSVERVYYYQSEDGRILPPDSPEVIEALRPVENNTPPAPRKKGSIFEG